MRDHDVIIIPLTALSFMFFGGGTLAERESAGSDPIDVYGVSIAVY
jgi:hypothetical protein